MQVLLPNFSCVIMCPKLDEDDGEFQQALEAGYKQIYIVTPKGIVKHHSVGPAGLESPLYVRTTVEEIPGYKFHTFEPEVNFFPDGKVPIALFHEVKAFFRKVIQAKGKAVEAMIWVLWNKDKGYFLHVPNQVVSHASATYDWAGLPRDSMIVVDIHSHADFNAFFSGTDDRDDANSIRFSAVIGHNDKPTVSFKARFNYLGLRREVTLSDIFEDKAPGDIEVPDSWINAVTTHQPTALPGGRPGMDGGFRHPQYPYSGPYSGPGYGNSTRVVPPNGSRFPHQEQKAAQARAQNGGSAFSRYYGGFPDGLELEEDENGSPWSHKNPNSGRVSGMSEEGLSSPRVIILGGREYVDTGYGLVPVTGRPEVKDPEVTEAKGSILPDLEQILAKIPDDIEARMEKVAHRQAQEDMLSDQADTHLGVAAIDLIVEAQDLPPEYDVLVCNHGKTVGDAYAIIDRFSTDLIESPEVLRKTVENLFQLVDDSEKIRVFRSLANVLPQTAIMDLAANGF
jgi:PRTRC genetic system protein A